MTTKELIKSLEAQGWEARENDFGVTITRGKVSFAINRGLPLETTKDGIRMSEWRDFYNTLLEYAKTPLEDRENKPKYRVRLRGFNSENGHQYLTAQDDNVRATRFFACAEKPDLKQEFTQDELDIIANRDQFKGVSWLQDLIRHAEPVEDDK